MKHETTTPQIRQNGLLTPFILGFENFKETIVDMVFIILIIYNNI